MRSLRPSCLVVGRVLQTWLDGELDARRSLRVAAHLRACVRCGLDADQYRWLSARIAGLEVPDDPSRLEDLQTFAAALTGDAVD